MIRWPISLSSLMMPTFIHENRKEKHKLTKILTHKAFITFAGNYNKINKNRAANINCNLLLYCQIRLQSLTVFESFFFSSGARVRLISTILSFSETESCSFVALFTTVSISTWSSFINIPLSFKVKGIPGTLSLTNFYI